MADPDEGLLLADLYCERGDRVLFRGLNTQLNNGQGLRIAGGNGTGKTTLLRIIAGLSQQYEGKVCWQGTDIQQQREVFLSDSLYIGHLPGIKSSLTTLENLEWWCALHNNGDVFNSQAIHSTVELKVALSDIGLSAFIDTPCQYLSAGQQRRAALARLLLSKHKLWILDEPFTAIDVKGVAMLEELYFKHLKRGGMVILSTHQDMHSHSFQTLDLDQQNTVQAFS